MKKETIKFEVGKTYIYKFFGDHDLTVPCKITKRTAKTITYVELDENKTYTKRIRESNTKGVNPTFWAYMPKHPFEVYI